MSTSAPRRTVDTIDRRVGLMFGVFLLLLLIGIVRAGYLGTIKSGALRAAANDQQVEKVPVPAPRGEITDRDGMPFAISEPADTIDVDPRVIVRTYKHPQVVADKLAPLVGLSRAKTLAIITTPGSQYEQLAAQVSAAKDAKIMSLQANGLTGISGIWDVPTEHLAYPLGNELGQVLGWGGSNGHGDGLELLFNKQLAGTNGKRRTVIDAKGKAISVETTKTMVPGKSLRLTISAPLQSEVEQVLAGVGAQYKPAGATAIVTDPQTDQILALANWPALNPNAVPSTAWTSVDGHVPAAEDQAVGMTYEPGSTFKAVTVSGALQDGLITPQTRFDVPPYLRAYGYTVTDAEHHGYEDLSVADILRVSSNIGADLIGRTLGRARFAGWVNRFGFGRRTGVALSGEEKGIIRPLSQYYGFSMYNLPFGQGEDVTPMQMVQAYDAIADGGVLRTPQIVESIGGVKRTAPRGKRIISAHVASEVRDMLRGVLADDGTASGAGIPGYDMAGKTGTAQVAVDGKYSKNLFVASFIGMVPASDPKLVVAVVVNEPQNGEYGGSVAAPAFQKIVGWAVPHFGIDPCPPASHGDCGDTTTSSTS